MAVWDPFREMNRLRREMEEIFDTVSPGRTWNLGFLPGSGARQYPKVNVEETAEGYSVEALAPGVEAGSLDLQVKENVLTISGEKRAPAGVPAEAYHRTERSAGRFVRTLEFPADIDAEKVSAAYADGILRVTLPKHPVAKPRQIQVEVG